MYNFEGNCQPSWSPQPLVVSAIAPGWGEGHHVASLPPSLTAASAWGSSHLPASCADLCGCKEAFHFFLSFLLSFFSLPPSDSCAHDTRVGFGPVYLRSVMSGSLKRLGQFRGDKWWSGSDSWCGEHKHFRGDGLQWGQLTAAAAPRPPEPHSLTLLPSSGQTIKNGYWVFTMSFLYNRAR